MLSKTELDYLLGRKPGVTPVHARVLSHNIRSKLQGFENSVLPALKQNPETNKWLDNLLGSDVKESLNKIKENLNAIRQLLEQQILSVKPLIDASASHKGLQWSPSRALKSC